MLNRQVFIILGISIIAIAVIGFFVFQINKTHEDEIAKYKAIAESERQRARAAEAVRRGNEQRKLAAIAERKKIEKKRSIEIQKQREKDEKQRLKKEKARKRREAVELKRQQRIQAKIPKVFKTTNFSFSIDPKNSKEIAVAQIYEGDKVSINVQRQGAEQKLFIGLLPMRAVQALRSLSGRRRQGMARDYYAKGPYGAPTLVTMPITDNESFTISNQLNSYHPKSRYLSVKNNRDGNILYIGTGLSEGSFITDMMGLRKGSFRVSVKIYSKNKWGIEARKLL